MLIQTLSKVIGFKLLVFLLVGSSMAGINECEKAYKSKNFSQAHIECSFHKLWDNGRAKFILASMWERGQGADNPIPELACRNFLLSAELDYCEAYQKTSACYKDGLIFEGSSLTQLDDAKKWAQKAQNCSTSPPKGDNRQKGITSYNIREYYWAIEYLKPFALKGDAEAQFYVGSAYFFTNRLDFATQWLKRSAANGNTKAKKFLDEYINPPQDLFLKGKAHYDKENYFSALNIWTPYAKNRPDDDNLQLLIGQSHEQLKQVDFAIEWYEKAKKNGNTEAILSLKRLSQVSDNDNRKKGFDAYSLKKYGSAIAFLDKFGDSIAQYYVGSSYAELDMLDKAIIWLTKSSNQGYVIATEELEKVQRLKNKGGSDDSTKQLTPYEKGEKAFQADDYSKALKYWTPLTRETKYANDGRLQYRIGLCYELQGSARGAERWFTKAAENGNLYAQEKLDSIAGDLPADPPKPKLGDYQKGLDAYKKKNYKVALEEWKIFANNNPNNSKVQNDLGSIYYYGNGIPKNYKRALEWFNKADKLNNKIAQYNLGIMHFNGNGVSKNDLSAYLWFKKSADQNYDKAQFKLAKLYFHGNGVRKNLNLAKDWAKKSANQGNTEAKKMLDEMAERIAPTSLDGKYQRGLEHLKKGEYKDAASWFNKAALGGYSPAQYELARLYEKGWGIPKVIDSAIIWYKKANGHYDVGRLYESKGSILSAFYWYSRASLDKEKKAKGVLLRLVNKNKNYLLLLFIPFGLIVKLRSNSKKKALNEKYIKDQQEKEKKTKETEEKEERAQEERNVKAKQARDDKAKKDREDKAKKDREDKAKKDREDKAKKSKEEELDKYILAAEAKSQNEKLEKARIKIESENKGVIKKDNKAKSKKVKTKKVQKIDAIEPRPKFRNPEKKRFQIVELVIGGSKWIKWRHSGVGSSDAAKVLSNKSSELLKLKNNKTDNAHSEELKLSSDILQKARSQYEEEIGLKVFPLCIQDNRFPWLMATIDGFSQEFDKLIKISYTELDYKEAKKGLYPRSLIQHQLMITGLEEIDYYCYLENQKSILITVKRDQKIIDKLYKAELAFAEKLSS